MAMNYYQYGVDLWENDMIVNDEFDSDQLDEDESYSWASGITDPQETCTANWRGWRSSDNNNRQQIIQKNNSRQILYETHTSNLITSGILTNINQNQNNVVLKLVDICAKYIALNMPFELVESYSQPVPEDLQLKITFASFPDSAEDIRLYSCLANGSSEEYQKGEQLYNNRHVKNLLQIGFHLSATVLQLAAGSGKTLSFNVAVVCDRKKITSCHCTCSKPSSWCSHIVAVCLSRIYEPLSVELRAPVSESLSKLQRDQLQKFAQYLISELPQQILPTAQKLLDELLKSNESSINLLSGAPDPTAGSSANEISVWCLDEQLLQENIHKTLSKFIIPSPHVVSDIDYLAHSSSAASAEYTSLLRPLRGREPEGMWNLISIVKELFRKRDKNSIPLLRIITNECVNLDQIINLWFLIKVSPLYNERGGYNQRPHNHNHTPPIHQACASLLDEIVSLWRIACYNPIYSIDEKNSFKELLLGWQNKTLDKLRKFCSSAPDKLIYLRRLDNDIFSAFQPAIDACQMSWQGYDFQSPIAFKRMCNDYLPKSNNNNNNQSSNTQLDSINKIDEVIIKRPVKSGSSSSEGFCEDSCKQTTTTTTISITANSKSSEVNTNDDLVDAVFDYEPQASSSTVYNVSTCVTELSTIQILTLTNINLSLNTVESKTLEILFSRCEALYAHGYTEHACILAKILADFLLASYNSEKIYDDLINCKNTNCNNVDTNSLSNKNKYVTNFQSCILWKAALLATVLLENTNCYQLAFRIGIFALEMPRQPASTKTLEVKLFNQETDLILLLKRIPITDYELNILRDRAKKIKEFLSININFNKCKCNTTNYVPLMLANFIFDILCSDKCLSPTDELIGFDAAVCALGYKPNVNETQHAIYCEGIRRQKGDLAITLLLTYKDDQSRLLKIMDKILDKEIHQLFKTPTNPFQPNLKRIQQNNLQKTDTVMQIPTISAASITTTNTTTNLTANTASCSRTVAVSSSTSSVTTSTAAFNNNSNNNSVYSINKTTNNSQIGKESSLASGTTISTIAELSSTTITTPSPQINTKLSNTIQQQPSSQTFASNSKLINNLKYSAIDSLSSGWEESESEGPNHNNLRLLETKFRCLNLNKQNNSNNKKVGSSFDSSAPETTSSDNSPTMNRKTNWVNTTNNSSTTTVTAIIQSANTTISETTTSNASVIQGIGINTKDSSKSEKNQIEKTLTQISIPSIVTTKDDESDNDSGESLSSGIEKVNNNNNSNTSSIVTISGDNSQSNKSLNNNEINNTKTINMTTQPWVDGSFNESNDNCEKNSEVPSTNNVENVEISLIENMNNVLTANPTEFASLMTLIVANNNSNPITVNNNNIVNNSNVSNKTSRSNRAKNKSPVYPNQPSEALAYFMFDFSKNLLSKAGGPISTSVFLNQNNNGPHRNLHICAFLIALYALGLHNCVQVNWFSRTYSSHVSWINGQAAEIGYPAICILIECWEGHLTPAECALLADRVSRVRDTMAVKAAAELALSSLKYSNSLNLQEIQRALVQCKEQSSDMLQRACLIVETSLKEGNNNNVADVLFEVARRWDELHTESLRNSQHLHAHHQQNFQSQQHMYLDSIRNNQHHQQQTQQQSHQQKSQCNINDFIIDPAIISTVPSISSITSSCLQQQATAVAAAAAAAAVANNYMQPTHLQQMPNINQSQQSMQTQLNMDPMIHTQYPFMQPVPQGPTSTQVSNQAPQAAPFAFAVQTLQYPQYPPQQTNSLQNTGPIVGQNIFIPAMYTAYGTIVPTTPGGPPQHTQNMLYSQNQTTNTHNNHYSLPQMNIYPPNVGTGYLFQNQFSSMMQTNNSNQLTSQHQQIQPKPFEIDSVSMKYLLSAFRVGMLALEALPRRADSSHQIKFLRNPSYGDNVKWLWNIAVKLGTNNLQQFCQTAANVIQNPFLIQELAFDTANYLCRNNPAHFGPALRSPMLNVLVQRCLNSYFRCCLQKMHHITTNDYEDFINMVLTARHAFYYSGNISCFAELLQNLKKSKACKKDLWSKLYNALNTSTNYS